MRKHTLITIFSLVIVLVGGVIYVAEPFNPDRRIVQNLSRAFMEDIQFKDFRSSALYHHEREQDRVDIGRSIERLFLVDPELLDIQDFRIVRTEVDSTAHRARVLVSARVRRLNVDDEPKETDLQLFWIRRHPECPLGSDCQDALCVDERGETVTEEVPDEDREQETEDDTRDEPSTRPISCDDSRDHAWFMNLDSTLESRDYR